MKKASSMIELVIAIVVMGIAMMTLPLMLTRVQNNNEFAMQQEILLALKTKIGDIITHKWDERSQVGAGEIAILDVANSDPELIRFPNNSQTRIGHTDRERRRKFFTNNTRPGGFGIGVPFDDIDDFIGTVTFNAEDRLDYRFNFNMITNVGYINDNTDYTQNTITFTFTGNRQAVAGSTNIKIITTRVVGVNISTFQLQTYSSNIGESQLLRRTYQ